MHNENLALSSNSATIDSTVNVRTASNTEPNAMWTIHQNNNRTHRLISNLNRAMVVNSSGRIVIGTYVEDRHRQDEWVFERVTERFSMGSNPNPTLTARGTANADRNYPARQMCRDDTITFDFGYTPINGNVIFGMVDRSGTYWGAERQNGNRNTSVLGIPECGVWNIRLRNNSTFSVTIDGAYEYNYVTTTRNRGVCTRCGVIRNSATTSLESRRFEHFMFRSTS